MCLGKKAGVAARGKFAFKEIAPRGNGCQQRHECARFVTKSKPRQVTHTGWIAGRPAWRRSARGPGVRGGFCVEVLRRITSPLSLRRTRLPIRCRESRGFLSNFEYKILSGEEILQCPRTPLRGPCASESEKPHFALASGFAAIASAALARHLRRKQTDEITAYRCRP